MLGLGFSPTSVVSVLSSASVLPPAYPAEGLRLWVDATELSTITKDGSDLVSAWASRYGSASFTSSGADRPTYQATGMDGNPAIDFTGSDVMNADSLASLFSGDDTPMAAFMVCEMDALQNNDLLVWGNSTDADSLMILRQTATQYAYIKREDAGGSAIGPIGGTTDTTPHVFSFRTNEAGTSATTRLDGADLNTASIDVGQTTVDVLALGADLNTASIDVGQTTVDVLALGARDSNGVVSTYTNGRIGEVLIYDRYVTDEEAAAIHTYLINKWGTNRVFFTGADSTVALTNSLTATQSILLSGTAASVAITNSCNATQAVNFTGADATVAMTNSCNATQVTPATAGTMSFASASSQYLECRENDLVAGSSSYTDLAIAAWVSVDSTAASRGMGIFNIYSDGNADSTPNDDVGLMVYLWCESDGGNLKARIYVDLDPGTEITLDSSYTLGTEFFFGYRYGGAPNNSVFYYDSATPVVDGGIADAAFSTDGNAFVNWGRTRDGSYATNFEYHDGTIKLPALWLGTDVDMPNFTNLYNGGTPPSAATIAAEGNCVSVIEASSNVNDDEVIGVSAWTNNNGVSIV